MWFWVYFRRLNAAMITDTSPVPYMGNSIDILGVAKIFFALDEL